jgi:hypothetical protein
MQCIEHNAYVRHIQRDMPAWVAPAVAAQVLEDDNFPQNLRTPLSTLVIMLAEIAQWQGKLVRRPLQDVPSWYIPRERHEYLTYPGAHRPLAVMRLAGEDDAIEVLATRYSDPLVPRSGLAPQEHSGWMGTAMLLRSAVQASPFFTDLQTVEVAARRGESHYIDVPDAVISTYRVWVKTQQSWSIEYRGWHTDTTQYASWRQGQPVHLATITVERPLVTDPAYRDDPAYSFELVQRINLYPRLIRR